MKFFEKITKRGVALVGIGFCLGLLLAAGIRFFAYSPYQVHYHANFAVYINGQREQFKDPSYYQEVAVCSSTHDIKTIAQRSHMHDNVNALVHVHDHVVTWGQFFEGIGWYVGPDFIQTKDGTMYREDEINKLNIIVNGQDYTGLGQLTTMVIGDKSRVLISYGAADAATLKKEYASVPATAAKQDSAKDPAACAGSEHVTIRERLKHLVN